MATTMAVANLGSLCSKLVIATRLSHCIRVKTSCMKNNFTVQPTRMLWASSATSSPKSPEHLSLEERKPKHPSNIFIMYLKTVQEQIQKDNPAASRKEVVSIASKMWKNVDPETKTVLSVKRKELFDKYKLDMKHFVDSMTPQEMKLEEKVKQKKTSKKLKVARRELNMPKMPASNFCCFLSDHYAEHAGDQNTSIFKKLREKWNSLSDQEKEKYNQEAQRRSEVYQEDMARWEKEMMELGRFDVIRKSTLFRLATGKEKNKRRNKKENLPEEL